MEAAGIEPAQGSDRVSGSRRRWCGTEATTRTRLAAVFALGVGHPNLETKPGHGGGVPTVALIELGRTRALGPGATSESELWEGTGVKTCGTSTPNPRDCVWWFGAQGSNKGRVPCGLVTFDCQNTPVRTSPKTGRNAEKPWLRAR